MDEQIVVEGVESFFLKAWTLPNLCTHWSILRAASKRVTFELGFVFDLHLAHQSIHETLLALATTT